MTAVGGQLALQINSGFSAKSFECGNRESDYVEEAAVDFIDEDGGPALSSVGAGLVAVLARFEIPGNFRRRETAEMNAGAAESAEDATFCAISQANSRDDFVPPAAQALEHEPCVGLSLRLAKN